MIIEIRDLNTTDVSGVVIGASTGSGVVVNVSGIIATIISDITPVVPFAQSAAYAISASWAPGAGDPSWDHLQNIPSGIVSSSGQVAEWAVATASYAMNVPPLPNNLVSSSTQIIYAGIANRPAGIVSSSTQASTWTVASASVATAVINLPSGVVSSSGQVLFNNITNVPVGIFTASSQVRYWQISDIPATVISSSGQINFYGISNVPAGIVSSSVQVSYTGLSNVPSGMVSSSEQIPRVGIADYADSVQYANILNLPALVSSSNQISFTGLTNVPLIFSASSQVSYTDIQNKPNWVPTASYVLMAQSASWAPGQEGGGTPEWSDVINKPNGLVSSSTQVSFIGLTNIPVNLVSASSQINYAGLQNTPLTIPTASYVQYTNIAGIPANIVSSSDQLPSGVISSSAQASTWTVASASVATSASSVAYNNVTGVPTLVSASSQISYTGLINVPSNIVSASTQVDYTGLKNKPATIPTASYVQYGNVAGIPANIISSSAQLPAGIVSSSAQVTLWSVASASAAATASFADSAATSAYADFAGLATIADIAYSASVSETSVSASYALSASWAPFPMTSATASYVSGGVVIIGVPTDGAYGGSAGNVSGLSSGDYIENAFDKVETILGKLAPAKPTNLSARTLGMNSTYSGLEASTGILRTTIVVSAQPTASWTFVAGTSGSATNLTFDGDSGTLSAEFDGNIGGTSFRNLATTSDVGTYGNLIILQDADPYNLTFGQQGFWKGFIAATAPTTSLALGVHTTRLLHSDTGNTPLYTFYVDNPRTPTVSAPVLSSSANAGRWISGVPSVATGDTFLFTFTGSLAVSQFYNTTRINAASSTIASTINNPLPTTAPVSGAFVTASMMLVTLANQYAETASFTALTYNSIGTSATNVVTGSAGTTYKIRVDTISNESNRLASGIGNYPPIGNMISGSGGAFDETISLVNNRELQMINNIYQYPPVRNYTNIYPTAGPNYTSLASDTGSLRWFTMSQSITAVSALTITFNAPVNFVGVETTGSMRVYALVSGSSPTNGWIDGSSAYPGTGNPTNNGDSALVIGSSTTSAKRITFGAAAKTGALFIRVGIPSNSTRTFTGVTVS